MLQLISELEYILLNTNETTGIISRYTRPDQLYMARAEMEPVISRLLDFMSKPVQIEFHNAFVRNLQRVVGAIGVLLGGVLTVVGAVAFLPAIIPAGIVSFMVFRHSQRNADQSPFENAAIVGMMVPTVLLSVPGGLVTLIGSSILRRSIGAVQVQQDTYDLFK